MYSKSPTPSSTTSASSRSTTGDGFEFVDKTADKVAEVAKHAEQLASRVAEQGNEAGERMKEVAGNLKTAVDKSVKDQPMATLAMIAIAGLVLGAIWKA